GALVRRRGHRGPDGGHVDAGRDDRRGTRGAVEDWRGGVAAGAGRRPGVVLLYSSHVLARCAADKRGTIVALRSAKGASPAGPRGDENAAFRGAKGDDQA